MEKQKQKQRYALQLGWKSATHEFTIAGGSYLKPPMYMSNVSTTPTDTFLFGSGTKPFTASAVMELVAKNLVSLDDPLMKHIDTVLDKLSPGTSMVSLFGDEAKSVTVGHILRMESGIEDFDQPAFDQMLLQPNETYKVHPVIEIIKAAASGHQGLLFPPGSQVCYTSTNYVLAGLVLLAHSPSNTTWSTMDVNSFFPEGVTGDAYYYRGTEMIDEKLTVPGTTGGGFANLPKLYIYNQSASILGWTCGNMVANAGDVAKFIWNLLGPDPMPRVLPAAQIEEMKQFKPISYGWAKGFISYGTGLMIEGASRTNTFPPQLNELGTYMGHGGDTYGFLSEQGIAFGLNASISVVANQDGNSDFVRGTFMCKVIEIAANILLDPTRSTNLKCETN